MWLSCPSVDNTNWYMQVDIYEFACNQWIIRIRSYDLARHKANMFDSPRTDRSHTNSYLRTRMYEFLSSATRHNSTCVMSSGRTYRWVTSSGRTYPWVTSSRRTYRWVTSSGRTSSRQFDSPKTRQTVLLVLSSLVLTETRVVGEPIAESRVVGEPLPASLTRQRLAKPFCSFCHHWYWLSHE